MRSRTRRRHAHRPPVPWPPGGRPPRVQVWRATEHGLTHSELGCAPIWAFQELTAVGAAKVLPDTLWLLLLLLERRSTKAGLHDRCRMHGD